jgi:hypothetical protein
MARRNMGRTDSVSVIEQATKLKPIVALDAWVRCPPLMVLVYKVVHDAPKVLFQIQGIEWDTELVGNSTSVRSIACTATTLFMIESPLQDR